MDHGLGIQALNGQAKVAEKEFRLNAINMARELEV